MAIYQVNQRHELKVRLSSKETVLEVLTSEIAAVIEFDDCMNVYLKRHEDPFDVELNQDFLDHWRKNCEFFR
jgi:hypothetical protein